MALTQTRAITPYVMDLVITKANELGHPPSKAAIGSVLQRLAVCSNSNGVVDQSVRQLAEALFLSEAVVKRVLRAATAAGVLVTTRKGGGVAKLPTRRQLRLDYHGDGELYLANEPARHREPSTEVNRDPSHVNTDPTASNRDPLGIHTQNNYKEISLPGWSALNPLQADKAAEACEMILEGRREASKASIQNLEAWVLTVRRDIQNRYGKKIVSLIRSAPTAPISLIASCAENNNSAPLAPYAADAVADTQTE